MDKAMALCTEPCIASGCSMAIRQGVGQLASLAHVNYTNLCAIALTLAGRTLILTSAIDNLGKGAAGQAIQNMNVMFGCPETYGLR